MNNNTLPLSVVIPTLGKGGLINVIAEINRWSIHPVEILICLTTDCNLDFEVFQTNLHIKIIRSNVKGQVAQRLCGFINSSQPYVLQLDDDVLIKFDSIVMLMNKLKLMPINSVVAPVMYDTSTNECIHKFPTGLKGLIMNLFLYIIAGAKWGKGRMGTISKAGTNYGVDPQYISSSEYEVDWLPGGCVLHNQASLYRDNYYPFVGKAYCEDLIHSCLLKNGGTNLFVIPNAKCYTESSGQPKGPEFSKDLIARIYLNKIRKVKTHHLIIWSNLKMIYNRVFNT